jgi:5-methylcytosine-specific restriction endonuclease McrA
MKRHTKIYMRHFGYDISDFIPCEICGAKAQDIHHISARGMGGDPQGGRDSVSNLMAVCRLCHQKFGDRKHYMDFLQEHHNKRLARHEVNAVIIEEKKL